MTAATLVIAYRDAVLVFLVVACADICWAKYIATASSKRPLPAACWAAAIYLAGAFTVVEYTQNHWLIIPALAGSFVGTWIGVRK